MNDRLITIALSVGTTFGLMQIAPESPKELTVERLIVTRELIVSDTGTPWEKGFEAHEIPRGIYAKSLGQGTGGLWVWSGQALGAPVGQVGLVGRVGKTLRAERP